MRRQDSSPSPAVRPTKPRPYAQPERQSAHRGAQLLRAHSRATAGTPNRNERSTGTSTASTGLHTIDRSRARTVATHPSFLNQNGLTYGVIRRQDTDKRGLKMDCKTAMGSNRTAITLRSVLGQSSAEPDSLTEAHLRRVVSAPGLAPRRGISNSCHGSLWRDQSISKYIGRLELRKHRIRNARRCRYRKRFTSFSSQEIGQAGRRLGGPLSREGCGASGRLGTRSTRISCDASDVEMESGNQ